MTMETVIEFDSLIVAAGAQQSYFGNDQFATFAPGMKTIDDALELRGRILGAFEAAEVCTDHAERERRLTFVVVGGGPTGVELAGQIAELAERTLAGAFRTIKPNECRVVLVEGADALMPPMGPKLGAQAQRRLEKMGVEIQLNSLVTDVDYHGRHREVQGRHRAADRLRLQGLVGRRAGEPAGQDDRRAVRRHRNRPRGPGDRGTRSQHQGASARLRRRRPDVVPGVPGMAQGALQGAKYATKLIRNELAGRDDPAARTPFKYFDKGSMATISRFSAVAKVGKLEFGGFIAWLAWLVAAPGLPRRLQEPLHHAHHLVHHVPQPQPRSDGHHQPDDLRQAGDGHAAEPAEPSHPAVTPGRRRRGRKTRTGKRRVVSDHTYRIIEIAGSSPDSIDAAIKNAISRASETIRGLDWFEVTSVRGHLSDGEVGHFQVTLKVGFRMEDA